MPVEIRHIRAFHAVAETLNFRQASERLGIAQPALSRTIKHLEDALRTSLFRRTTRVTRLTDSGRSFLKHTAGIIADLDRAIDLAQRAHSGLTGELRVGFNDLVITNLLPQVVRRFRSDHPHIEVELIDESTPQALEMVLDETCDIAFIVDQHLQPELDRIVVRDEQIVCVLPASHPLSSKERISVTELANEPFIMGRWDAWKTTSRPIRDFCIAHGFVPNIIQEVDHSDGIMGLVAAEMGVTLHVDGTLLHSMKGIAVRPLLERPPEIRTAAIWRRDCRAASPALDRFIGAIADVAAQAQLSPG